MKTTTKNKRIQLTFSIHGDWLFGDSKWAVVCNETTMLIGCSTRKECRDLKNDWTQWEFVDQTRLPKGQTIEFYDNKGLTETIDYGENTGQDWQPTTYEFLK
tara:strand:+ start:3890 stop:4195 length:306 start_codon:yes stop_codon:yes gene_type:complete